MRLNGVEPEVVDEKEIFLLAESTVIVGDAPL
jgi:hypothetical protein